MSSRLPSSRIKSNSPTTMARFRWLERPAQSSSRTGTRPTPEEARLTRRGSWSSSRSAESFTRWRILCRRLPTSALLGWRWLAPQSIRQRRGSRIFCWLRGVRWEPEPDGRSTDALIGCLNAHDDQPGRIAAIYALAARPEAVGALLADLQSHGQRAGILMQGDSGPLRGDDEALMADAVKWSEDAVVMEDAAYSLAAVEPSAEVCALVVDALHSQSPDDEWALLNLVFVIGEHGPAALAAAGRLISLARSSTSHRVVRMCLASLTQMMDSTAAPELQERAAVAVAELLHGAPRAEDCRFASFQRRFLASLMGTAAVQGFL